MEITEVLDTIKAVQERSLQQMEDIVAAMENYEDTMENVLCVPPLSQLAALCTMFDRLCETYELDKKETMELMHKQVLDTNEEHGDAFPGIRRKV